jgi:spore protease
MLFLKNTHKILCRRKIKMETNGRTDLASEAHSLWKRSAAETTELPGVRAREEKLAGLAVTEVEILDARGAQALKKPVGSYFTLELPRLLRRFDEGFPAAASALAALLRRCLDESRLQSVLVAALGNAEVTPDAVGSCAARHVLVTRHLKRREPETFRGFRSAALLRPGVLGTSGVESAEQLKAMAETLKPDAVIAVDALAGCDLARLCRCVQVSDTGIAPGSGVGNDRPALDRQSLGVPVIAVGVPTVIDASALGEDAALRGMFVTPRGIDQAVAQTGRLIGYAINLALHPGLTLEDVDLLAE